MVSPSITRTTWARLRPAVADGVAVGLAVDGIGLAVGEGVTVGVALSTGVDVAIGVTSAAGVGVDIGVSLPQAARSNSAMRNAGQALFIEVPLGQGALHTASCWRKSSRNSSSLRSLVPYRCAFCSLEPGDSPTTR